jgi:hypothetical protein
MRTATNSKSGVGVDSTRRLTVRLTKMGEPDRVLEFHAGADRARVIGCAPNADVVLRDPGVLPVHCYFERERGDLWLSSAQAGAATRVNYQPALGRVKLGKRSILEVGDARLQVLVIEEEENAPRHGKFGTEVIELGELDPQANLFETTPVDMSAALNQFPTTAWKWTDATEGPAVVADAPAVSTIERAATPEPSCAPVTAHTVPIPLPTVAPPPVAVDRLTTTERIPRVTFAAPPNPEPIQPVLTSPCILIEARNRLISAPPPAPAALSAGFEDETVPGIRPSLHAPPHRPVSPPSPPTVAHASAGPNASPRWPVPVSASLALDPSSFATVGHPIADLFTAAEPILKSTPARAAPDLVQRIASHRERFAVGLGRDPKVIATAVFLAALSLSALVSQAVRGWREIAAFSVVGAGPKQAQLAGPRNASRANGMGPSPIASPALAATVSATPASEIAHSSDGDPLVDQAVSHLLSGRHAEASAAYEVLATRYPGEPVYSAIAKILRRRLNPACKQGSELECGKALP